MNTHSWASPGCYAPRTRIHSTVTLLAKIEGLCRHITSLREMSGVQAAQPVRCARRLRRPKRMPVIRPSRS